MWGELIQSNRIELNQLSQLIWRCLKDISDMFRDVLRIFYVIDGMDDGTDDGTDDRMDGRRVDRFSFDCSLVKVQTTCCKTYSRLS